ncbi:MAG: PilZ domain-containing protein [Candidatus Methylomirabilales bacterium]
MGKKQRDKRRFSRVMVGGTNKGRVTALYDASLVDISLGGVLIEHVQVVRPGTTSSLDFELHGKRLSLKCRVARSVVHRTEMQPDGEQSLIYHTGLEFVDLADGTRQLICNYIQSIIENGNETRAVLDERIPVGALDRKG